MMKLISGTGPEMQARKHERTHSMVLHPSSSGSPFPVDPLPPPDDSGDSSLDTDKAPSPNYAYPPEHSKFRRTTSSFSQTTSSVANLELTSKGKKRKRLAKACSACHKNKRRCDGFSPCSNCEFSSRQCIYLNAKGEVIPPPKTRDGSASDPPGGIAFEMEAADSHPTFDKEDDRAAVAGSTPAERTQRHLDADTFRRPLPRASFGAYGENRPDNIRRESQATMSSRYSERTPSFGHVLPSPPVHPQAGLPQSTQRQADPLHKEVPMGGSDIESRPDATGRLNSASTQRTFQPSASRTSQPLLGMERSSARADPPPQSSADAKLRAVDRHASFVEELLHAFFTRLHPYQLMFHTPTFQYRRYLKLVPSALLHMMYALAIRFVDPITLRDVLATEHASAAEIEQPSFLAGEVFANEAKHGIDIWVKQKGAMMQRASWSSGSLHTWEDLEMLMAIALCGFYEKAMMRPSDAAQHFGTFTHGSSEVLLRLTLSRSQT
jgi:hypothetical protein